MGARWKLAKFLIYCTSKSSLHGLWSWQSMPNICQLERDLSSMNNCARKGWQLTGLCMWSLSVFLPVLETWKRPRMSRFTSPEMISQQISSCQAILLIFMPKMGVWSLHIQHFCKMTEWDIVYMECDDCWSEDCETHSWINKVWRCLFCKRWQTCSSICADTCNSTCKIHLHELTKSHVCLFHKR